MIKHIFPNLPAKHLYPFVELCCGKYTMRGVWICMGECVCIGWCVCGGYMWGCQLGYICVSDGGVSMWVCGGGVSVCVWDAVYLDVYGCNLYPKIMVSLSTERWRFNWDTNNLGNGDWIPCHIHTKYLKEFHISVWCFSSCKVNHVVATKIPAATPLYQLIAA